MIQIHAEARMIRRRALSAILLIANPWCASRACAAELEVRFEALERIVAAQLFTQDGRHYVRGSRAARCQFAYLEAPRIDSDHGRLRVRARFSGRSALDVFNSCVGLGDSFDLTLTAAPAPHDGAIVLRDVNVSTVRDSYYIRRVRAALGEIRVTPGALVLVIEFRVIVK
jgi:hypothetical protein